MAKEPKLYTTIQGIDSSAKIRADLAAENRKVIVSFSAGKDSICAAIALRDAGIETEFVFFYGVPGLRFVQEGLDSLSEQLGQRIHQFPHPAIYRQLGQGMFQTPARVRVIEAAQIPRIDYPTSWRLIKDHLGLPQDTWIADGVRANDSPQRRMAIQRYGAKKPNSTKVSVVWDWSVAKVRACLAENNIQLPIDYEWFGRSFDGKDHRFVEPIARNAPDDFERIRRWFPLVDMELVRHEL